MVLEEFVAVCAALGWCCAQVIKTVIALLKHQDCLWRDMLAGTGGTPSSHTAFVTALSASIYTASGLTLTFLLALSLTILTIRDAVGVRRDVGLHAQLLNQLTKTLLPDEQALPIKVGHNVMDVVFGVVVGLLAVLAALHLPMFQGRLPFAWDWL